MVSMRIGRMDYVYIDIVEGGGWAVLNSHSLHKRRLKASNSLSHCTKQCFVADSLLVPLVPNMINQVRSALAQIQSCADFLHNQTSFGLICTVYTGRK